MAFVELPPGRFTMGSASLEAGRNDDETLHDVGDHEAVPDGAERMTQQKWRTVMGGCPPTSRPAAALPVENVTFAEVQKFIES